MVPDRAYRENVSVLNRKGINVKVRLLADILWEDKKYCVENPPFSEKINLNGKRQGEGGTLASAD